MWDKPLQVSFQNTAWTAGISSVFCVPVPLTPPGERADTDLAKYFCALEHLSSNIKESSCTHSGDFFSAERGTCEYIPHQAKKRRERKNKRIRMWKSKDEKGRREDRRERRKVWAKEQEQGKEETSLSIRFKDITAMYWRRQGLTQLAETLSLLHSSFERQLQKMSQWVDLPRAPAWPHCPPALLPQVLWREDWSNARTAAANCRGNPCCCFFSWAKREGMLATSKEWEKRDFCSFSWGEEFSLASYVQTNAGCN